MVVKTIDKLMLNGQAYNTAYNSTVTIQKNWATVDSFTLNQSADKTVNIAVPTNSDYVDLTTNQTVAWTKTFSTSPVVPAKSSAASAANTTAIATEAQVALKQNTLTAWSNIQINGDTISATDTTYSEVTKSDLDAGTSTTAWVIAAKSIADYVKGKVSNAYIYRGSVATYADLPSTWLTAWDVYNVEAAHTSAPKFPAGSNLAWDGTAWDVLGWIFDVSNFVDLTSNQTIGWTKTFSTSPVVPSKTTAAANTGTAIATEAQVYKKQDTLTLPSTPTAWHIVTWWANNKTFADWGAIPTSSDYVDLTSNQSVGWVKTFTSEPVLPSKTTAATNTGTKPATEAQVYAVAQAIPTVWNATLTLTQWGTSKGTFTANSTTATTVDFNTSFVKTQTEYDNLPSSKTTDWNFYFIYS